MSFTPYGAAYQQPVRHRSFSEARIHRREHRSTASVLREITLQNRSEPQR
jgi:hypothetical protein